VTSHSLIIVREFDLMQGISEPHPGRVQQMLARKSEAESQVVERCAK